MKFYLAHNYSQRLELRKIVPEFTKRGHEVTSRWILEDSHDSLSEQRAAKIDLIDIERSDFLVLFTDQKGQRPGRGKYIEFGYAFAFRKYIILVGTEMNTIFYYLKSFPRFFKLQDLLDSLDMEATE